MFFFAKKNAFSYAPRMRILYSHRVQSRDGQGVHIEELIRALRGAGHKVLVVGPGFYEQAEFGGESRAVTLIRRALPGALQELAELAYNIPAYLRLARAYASFKPDFVYERCNLYFLAGAWLARRTSCVLLLEVNAPLADERSAHGGLRLAWLGRALEHFTWRSATAILPVTAVLGDELRRGGVAPERIHIIANGVDLARFPAKPDTAPSPRIELGFVGFVRDWHGLDGVIDGMSKYEPGTIALTVIGDGPARPALEAQAASLGLSQSLHVTGVVPPEQVPDMVGRFDIALQPKATPYASPLKIFDYMAAGCAIVAPDQPNIREVLQHGQTALLFDPASSGAMWQSVRELVEDTALRQRLGAAARAALIRQNRTWAGNAGRVAAIAQAAIAAAAPRA